MASTIAQLDQLVSALAHKAAGSTTSADRYALGSMALDKIGQRLDLWETRMRTPLTPALFPGEGFAYAIPSDVKGDAIIDIRPVGSGVSVYDKKPNIPFDRESKQNSGLPDFTIEQINGTRILRVNSTDIPRYSTLHACSSLTDNGTWSASDDATGLAADSNNGIGDDASLRFNVVVATSANNDAVLENSTMTAVDLTDYQNIGSIFFKVWIPDNTYITSVNLRVGTDSSNYYSATKTVQADGRAIVKGVNIFRIDWTDFATTGSPTITNIKYLRFQLTYSASQTDMPGVLLDDIVARIGKLHELVYYSEYICITSGGTRQRRIVDASDLTVLGSEGEGVLIETWASLICGARREYNDATAHMQEAERLAQMYEQQYPTERPELGYEHALFGFDPNSPGKPRY